MRIAYLLLLGVIAAAVASPQQAPPEPPPAVEDPGLIITAETNLVLLSLHVYQGKKSVANLGPESFEVLEDGVPQQIAFVEGPTSDEQTTRSVPTEIIFLIDFSYSVMSPGLLDFTTINETMLSGLRDDVSISVYGFAHNLKKFTGPTRDLGKLQRALDNAHKSEDLGSKVYEAIMQTARDATSKGGNMTRMMIVFSDGLSTTSLDPELVVRSANGLGVTVYPVVLGHDRMAQRTVDQVGGRGIQGLFRETDAALQQNRRATPNQGIRQANARENLRLMRVFADMGPRTGGRSYDLSVLNNKVIRTILGSLAEVAETEYVVGYYSQSPDDEPSGHLAEARLKPEVKGELFGGRRIVVH